MYTINQGYSELLTPIEDQLFLVKSRLEDIYTNGKSYSKGELLKQLAYLNRELEEL